MSVTAPAGTIAPVIRWPGGAQTPRAVTPEIAVPMPEQDTPSDSPKLCECGCGQPAPIAPSTSTRDGWVKGQPMRFVNGHSFRGRKHHPPVPEPTAPLCACGCGERVSRGRDGGYLRFRRGHWSRRRPGVPACGYVPDPETGCWEWQLYRDRNGYGISGQRFAHIVVWEQHRGPVPTGLELHHECENPPCVNPDHLRPVTHTENMRLARHVKLDAAAVRDIRRSGDRTLVLAERYGISETNVRRVRRGESWKGIE